MGPPRGPALPAPRLGAGPAGPAGAGGGGGAAAEAEDATGRQSGIIMAMDQDKYTMAMGIIGWSNGVNYDL